jgi:alpha-beta hydrolase superfamily lysophospholipase
MSDFSAAADNGDQSAQARAFTLADATALMAQMPALTFEPQHDCRWAKTPKVQTYLNYYRINFAEQDNTLIHGFGSFQSEGFTIAAHYWLPPNPRGTLVIVHGYYDHTGVFNNAIAFGLAQGLAVLAYDLPGHGLSSGERATIDTFDCYANVLQQLLTLAPQCMPTPFYALGQSTGGAVLLNHLWRHPAIFHRIALCAPLILPRGWNLGRFTYLLLHKWVTHLPRNPSRSSHDPQFIRFIDELDCLQSKQLSVRWVGAMKAWHRQFKQFSVQQTPLLLVQGTADLTVLWRYNTELIQRKLPQLQCVYIEGAGHQLVNELPQYRTAVFNAIQQHFFVD